MNLLNDRSGIIHKVSTYSEAGGKSECTTVCGKYVVEGISHSDYFFVKYGVNCKSCLKSKKK